MVLHVLVYGTHFPTQSLPLSVLPSRSFFQAPWVSSMTSVSAISVFSASRGNDGTIQWENPWRPKITCIKQDHSYHTPLDSPDQIDGYLLMQLRNESGYKFGQLENLTQKHPVTSDCEKTFAPYSHGRFRGTPFLSKEVHPHSSTSQCSVQ